MASADEIAARAYLAKIGAKGGKASGEVKARDPEHYKRLAKMKAAAAMKRDPEAYKKLQAGKARRAAAKAAKVGKAKAARR